MLLPVFIVIAGILALSHFAPFPFLFDAVAGELSVWRVPQATGQRRVYLTFDDGPNPAITPELLDILREQQVQATFFLIDAHIDQDTAPIVHRIFAEGHAVGQHSGNRWQMLHSPEYLAAELEEEASRMERLAGRRPCPLFRPHAGWRSVPMLKGLSRKQYRLIGWSWLSWDLVWFRKRTGARVASQVISNAIPGGIIVLHDGHHRRPRADRRYTLEAVRIIIQRLREDGYTFGRLCDTGMVSRNSNDPNAPKP